MDDKGLSSTKWAAWRRTMLMTGSYDPNEYHELNSYQQSWSKDTLNTMRDIHKRDYDRHNPSDMV